AFGCPSGPLVVTAEQVLVLLHHRAATGRICADILGVRALEGGDVRARQRTSRIEVASVCVQRSATSLTGRVDDGVSVDDERALGGAIRLAQQSLHHASEQQRDGSALSVAARRVVPRTTIAP